MQLTSILPLLLLSSFLLACSQQHEEEEKTQGHVWQQQVDTINDAKTLREQVNKDTQQRQEALDRAAQE